MPVIKMRIKYDGNCHFEVTDDHTGKALGKTLAWETYREHSTGLYVIVADIELPDERKALEPTAAPTEEREER